MSVSNKEPVSMHIGNGVTTSFLYDFAILRAADLVVTVNDVEQVGGYSVTNVGLSSGDVIFAVAPANGAIIVLYRSLEFERVDTDYQPAGALRYDAVNRDFDRTWMALQELKAQSDRSFRLSLTVEGVSTTLPTPVANRSFKWDPTGTFLITSDTDPDQAANDAEAAAQAAELAKQATQLLSDAAQLSAQQAANSAASIDFTLNSASTFQNKTLTASGGNNVEASASPYGGQLAGNRNKIINGAFQVNQRLYASASATTAGQYTLDRWKVTGTGGITFAATAGKTTVTIPSGQTLQQVIEGISLQSGDYVLSWEGTAQARIGAGAYGASGSVKATITGGTNTTIEFNAGTVANVQLELGEKVTPFEHRHVAGEIILCRRYYQEIVWAVSCSAAASAQDYYSIVSIHPMRAAPSVVKVGGTFTNSTDPGTPVLALNSYSAYARSVTAGQIYASYTVRLSSEL